MSKILSVLVDSREPDWVTGADFGAPSTVTTLEAGDVWAALSDDVLLIVERKTPDDLLGSIADGRLFHQVKEMVKHSPWTYVVITGALIPDSSGCVNGTGWKYSAVQGALLTVQELGAHVVYCDGQNDFPKTIQRIASRDRSAMRLPAARTAEALTPGQNILAALPGIGPNRVLELSGHFPNTAWALQFLTDLNWTSEIPGIANGVKGSVRRALGLEDDHMLAVIPLNEGDSSE